MRDVQSLRRKRRLPGFNDGEFPTDIDKSPTRSDNNLASQIHTVVALIPRGTVATYGQIAALAQLPGRARWVGRVLSQLPPESTLPWHRVINSQGVITCPSRMLAATRLIADGIEVRQGRVNLARYRWNPGD